MGEVALQVSDKRVIENSILGLIGVQSDDNDDNDADDKAGGGIVRKSDETDADAEAKSEIVIMLLTKLVTRIARKPSRAQKLSFWIRTVLVALISKVGSSTVPMG